MAVRKPPAHLAEPNLITLPAGTVVERVHDRHRDPTRFDPCRGAPTRFAPIHDVDGNCVPSLYGASTLEAAIYETIFHDIPATARLKTVPRTLVQGRAHSRLTIMRDLRLVSLRAPDLRRWRVRRNSLITTSPILYGDTARWAEAIHHQFMEVEGLLWTSNPCDPDTAFVFFGGRIASGDFDVVQTRDGAADMSFLSDVRLAGQKSEISISV